MSIDQRTNLLYGFGAAPKVVSELLSYNAEVFDRRALEGELHFPLEDEKFIDEWRTYVRQAEESDFRALAEHLVQLHFPVRRGISETPDYIAATRRGVNPQDLKTATGLSLERPEQCRVLIHQTWAGRIPVIQPACRADFVSLVRAFSHRNEPVVVPKSMGACLIAGYNNWSRFHRLRRQWLIENPGRPFSPGSLSGDKESYQDRFMILSDGWYSGVPPERLLLSDAEWRRLSLIIRREHESAHYWTRRVLSSMRNHVMDEIIADYCGLVSAIDRFRADWLLTFFGLEDHPRYREGGRLQNYRGRPPLSEDGFLLLQKLVVASALNLETFYSRHAGLLRGSRGTLLALLTLTGFTLEELAARSAPVRLSTEMARAEKILDRTLRLETGLNPHIGG